VHVALIVRVTSLGTVAVGTAKVTFPVGDPAMLAVKVAPSVMRQDAAPTGTWMNAPALWSMVQSGV
jgi:hypothetical protein